MGCQYASHSFMILSTSFLVVKMRNLTIFLLNFISLALIVPAQANPSLTITPTAESGNGLRLHGEGAFSTEIKKIAVIQVSTPSPNVYGNNFGYTIALSSSEMKNDKGGPDISYQVIAIPLGATDPQSSDFSVMSNHDFVQCSIGPLSLDVYVKYTPASLQEPGDYSGTINVTVTDNQSSCL